MVRKSIASNIVLNIVLNLARSNPKHEDRGEVNVQKFVVTSSQSLFIDGLQLVREKLAELLPLNRVLTAESNLEISLRSNARLQIEIIKKLWWKKFVNVLALHLIAITVSGTNFHLNKLELFLYNI